MRLQAEGSKCATIVFDSDLMSRTITEMEEKIAEINALLCYLNDCDRLEYQEEESWAAAANGLQNLVNRLKIFSKGSVANLN